MSSTKQPISKESLFGLLNSRVSFDYNASQKIISKTINEQVQILNRIYYNPGTHINSLIFIDCEFNESVGIGRATEVGTVSFQNCVFNKEVVVQYNDLMLSTDCIFNDNLKIKFKEQDDVTFSGYNIKGTLELLGNASRLKLETINDQKSIDTQNIILSVSCSKISLNNIFCKNLEFKSKLTFNAQVLIEETEAFEIIIGEIQVNKGININNCKFSKLKIEQLKGDTRSLTILDSTIGEIYFKASIASKTSISDSAINKFVLWDSNDKESILNIEKTTIQHLEFQRLFNNGQLTLRELTIPKGGQVSFKSSNLGKADFIYCDFSKAVLDFENSKITEAFFSETEFPKKVLVNGVKNHGQAQLTFGQLATAFQKQGDNIRALEYNSREIESHYRNIKWLSTQFSTKLSLWLNSISNNFGRSWVYGVLFSFAIGLLFFCLLLISTNKYVLGFPSFDSAMLPAYLKFMNPLRFFELETLFNNTPKEGLIKLNSLSFLADFAGRIFVGYGYYQTIQAFRRFGRK